MTPKTGRNDEHKKTSKNQPNQANSHWMSEQAPQRIFEQIITRVDTWRRIMVDKKSHNDKGQKNYRGTTPNKHPER
jgi:tellurite resistance-related uncharacterized protein